MTPFDTAHLQLKPDRFSNLSGFIIQLRKIDLITSTV